MMLLLKEPTEDEVRWFLSAQEELPFSYTRIGVSRWRVAQPGYAVGRFHVKRGEGKEAYAWAVDTWLRLLSPNAPVISR